MKLWQKGYEINKEVEKYTVGNDYIIDLKLVKYDCVASIAHAKMLKKIGVLNQKELESLVSGLNEILALYEKGQFKIKPEQEDCHTAIEAYLTEKLGEVGKKIHTGRSRNDQVLTAVRLYEKAELAEIKILMNAYRKTLLLVISQNGKIKMPGYTHMQRAMPSSVDMWLSGYADAMTDDLIMLEAVQKMIDQNPLGSGAGFGVPVFELDPSMTAKEMGFSRVMKNAPYCQLSRGKFEGIILHVLSQIMLDLNRLATDLILFSMKEFGYVTLPKEFCTGSSIMPQKKNPDVLELLRAKYHVVYGEETKVMGIVGNLMSGFNRDLQLTKEPLMNSIEITKDSLKIISLVVSGMEINASSCEAAMTSELYATEETYKLVKEGMSFRDAYKKVGEKYSK